MQAINLKILGNVESYKWLTFTEQISENPLFIYLKKSANNKSELIPISSHLESFNCDHVEYST